MGKEKRTEDIPLIEPSTLETIDYAFYEWVDKSMDIHVDTNKGFKKVPVIWVSAERAFQIKRDKGLRDGKGVLKLPLITVERKAMKKDPNIADLEKELSDKIGLKTSIAFNESGSSGSLTLYYSDLNQLDEIMKRLKKK